MAGDSLADPFANSPLFAEYLEILDSGNLKLMGQIDNEMKDLSPDDALVIIDMQNDFLVMDPVHNPNGGAFGVPEGNKCIVPICRMIQQASEVGATIVTTRDYHPVDHVSFMTEGGPFPPHCVQGGEGSKVVPDIAEEMAKAKNIHPDKVHVVFKGFHEDADSFGGFPYAESTNYPNATKEGGPGEGIGRICTRKPGNVATCPMSCSTAPWTGSIIVQQSALQMAAEEKQVTADDINCPPDIMGMHEEGKRGRKTLHEYLQENGIQRLFVCGLALDFCVLDTCINAKAHGFKDVYLVIDAARAAHIEKVGTFGTGFLSPPAMMLESLATAGVKPTFTVKVMGFAAAVSPKHLIKIQDGQVDAAPKLKERDEYPNANHGLNLTEPKIDDNPLSLTFLQGQNSYKIEMAGDLKNLQELGWGDIGRCSPVAPLLPNWPHAPRQATKLCWAYPLADSNNFAKTQIAFLKMSSSEELTFAIRGGFLLLSEDNTVLKVQLCGPGKHLQFGQAQKLPDNCKDALKAQQRLQNVTLPFLRKRGAQEFCWIHPNEEVGGITALDSGAFAYALEEGNIFFPIKAMTSMA